MSNISLLLRLVNGIARQVDLSVNTLVVGALTVGSANLTQSILNNLINLQNGTDFSSGANSHTHDGRYFTKTQIQSTTGGSAGSTLVGDDNSYSHFTPSAATVKGALAGIDSALGTVSANSSFDDSFFNIFNHVAPSKKIAFDASAISTSTTRTIAMPDSNVDLAKVLSAIQKDGSITYTADQPMGSHKLTSLSAGTAAGHSVRYEQAILTSGANPFAADQSFGGFKASNIAYPTVSTDAASKQYVDDKLDGRTWKQTVRAIAVANITLSGPQTIDGVSVIAGDRVLAVAQTSAANNGIYIVAAGAWSRSSDLDNSPTGEVANGDTTMVGEGTSYKGTEWTIQGLSGSYVINVDPMPWVQTAGPGSFTAGNGISITGTVISASLDSSGGLEFNGSAIRVKLADASLSRGASGIAVQNDPAGAIVTGGSGILVQLESSNPTLQISSNRLGVKLDAARAITTGASGIGVNVDNSTLTIATNQVKVANAGIGATQLATGAFDQVTITGGAGTAAAVQQAPALVRTFTAGQSFSANTTYGLRWGIPGLGETANRVYAADYDATSNDKFWVIALFNTNGAIVAGNTITATVKGPLTLGSSDTTFASGDQGKPVWLGAAGAYLADSSVPSATNQANFKMGIAETSSIIWVDCQMLGVN